MTENLLEETPVTETHQHLCKFARGMSAHKGVPNDCVCDCGAVYHLIGWQEIRVLTPSEMPLHSEDPAKDGMVKNPCAVIMDDGEFDVEEYRADLQRRYDQLTLDASLAETAWHRTHSKYDEATMDRLANKARGLEMALSLLPRKPHE